MLIPNLDHDAHDGTLAEADSWLPGVLAGPDFTAARLAVAVTADENGGPPATACSSSSLPPACTIGW